MDAANQKFKIGLNMGPLMTDFRKEPTDVLKALAEIGYNGIEITPDIPLPIDEFCACVDDLGIEIPSIHTPTPETEGDFMKLLDFANKMRCRKIVFGGYHPDKLKSEDGYKSMARMYNQTGKYCHEYAKNVQAFYHNHHWELKKIGDKRGLEIFIDETDPRYVNLELDVCWLAVGGVDPASFIKKYESRCRLIHYKDIIIKDGYAIDGHSPGGILKEDGYTMIEGSYEFTEAGGGAVDFEKIQRIINNEYISWIISEQDRVSMPPLQSARINHDNIKRIIDGRGVR